jgi:tetraacyldisaccharide 4'-kinase
MFKTLLSKIFSFFVSRRNIKFDNSNEIVKCKVPVVSVGNLSVGGTGKTPFVQMLTKYFLSKNFMPGIVGRGYKRKSKGEIIVGDTTGLKVNATIGGDEMVLLADSLRVPVIAHDSKSLAAISMQEKYNVDLIIVDDGFQHRKLHRDLDIVLIDKETNDKPELMPAGRLREPISSLIRADIVCIMGSFSLNEDIRKNIRPDAVVINVKPIQTNPYYLSDKQQIKLRDAKETQVKVFAFAGIAKPNRFFDMLKDLGFICVATHSFDDHYGYIKSDIELLIKKCKENNCTNIATTEKDAAKIIEFNELLKSNKINCIVFPIALTIAEGKIEFFKLVGSRINKQVQRKRLSENESIN